MPVAFATKKLEGGRKAPFIPLREREGAVEEWMKSAREEAPVAAPSHREDKMKVRMLVDKPASEDGINVKVFEAGKSYDVSRELGEKWLATGIAQEDKMLERAPEIKDAGNIELTDGCHDIQESSKAAKLPDPPVTKAHKAHKKGRR